MQSIVKWLGSLDPLANLLQSPFVLATRVYVGWVFLKSGMLKLEDWEQTVALFEYEYRVPLLSPSLAAVAGTAGELLFGVLVIVGLGGRFAPLGLFAVNALAVISYAHIFYADTGAAGRFQHYLWGFMLAMLFFYGMGKWSADALLRKWSASRQR
jgi:putative oxidoreductase